METILLKAFGALGGRKFLVAVGTVVYQAMNSGQPVNWGIVGAAVAYIVVQGLIDYATSGASSTAAFTLTTARAANTQLVAQAVQMLRAREGANNQLVAQAVQVGQTMQAKSQTAPDGTQVGQN